MLQGTAFKECYQHCQQPTAAHGDHNTCLAAIDSSTAAMPSSQLYLDLCCSLSLSLDLSLLCDLQDTGTAQSQTSSSAEDMDA